MEDTKETLQTDEYRNPSAEYAIKYGTIPRERINIESKEDFGIDELNSESIEQSQPHIDSYPFFCED